MILCFVHCKIHLVACGLGQLLMLYVLSYCLPGFFLEFKSDSKEKYFLSKNIFLKIKKKKKDRKRKKANGLSNIGTFIRGIIYAVQEYF